ncbi:MAG TPA: type II toxin-antitoxin system prevent-host-death family antitoxin, partial [Luteolibacter sp.]|nr:type II toxin-antitoxin system prevent-host-death family antitoxin [Luteolibacter sp.]
NRLSELLDNVLHSGAQTITRHGKPIAVVVSAETYARLQPKEKLVDILRDCPVKDWTIERETSGAREIRFE